MSSRTVIVVSGLPRSGTSMMMKMLEAGGKTILTDNLREADANNPKGYYEFQRVKQMKDGDLAWLPEAVGKVVKIVTGLITYLPVDYNYKVIFMQRNLDEVLSSQKKMLGRLGRGEDNIADDKMASTYEEHLKQVKAWLVRQTNIEILYVNYNAMVADPTDSLRKVDAFLGGGMDVQKMASVVDGELYRERKQAGA
ncbi:MAG: sulfotransferase [Anaerolineae bacterium]|nr:sulfotransferase [Anaerolineae bacterium]